ncbi:MAG TPA: hypothetical protein VEH29_03395 [Acidimicrobiales bacterium]|nr:hypothetical protein [Acidimicrobiales bacterium]
MAEGGGTSGPTGPAPGSPEEAAIILRALAAGAASSGRTLPMRKGTIVAAVVIVVATVLGLIVGADYLRHDIDANTTAGNGSATGPVLTPAEVNLKSAVSAAASYEAAHGQSLQGLTATVLARAVPALDFSAVSGSPGTIAVGTSVPGSLVMTSFQTNPAACVGVLLVASDEPAAIFGSYPVTARPGTYFFEAPAPAGLCNALTVAPPPGSYVLTTGFPTGALP